MDYLHPTYALSKKIHKLRRKHGNPNLSSSHHSSTPSSSSFQFLFNQKWQPLSSNNLMDKSVLPLNSSKQPTFFKISTSEKNLQAFISSNNAENVSITYGLAVCTTMGVFFAAFLLTLGCRLYSKRIESKHRSQNSSSSQRHLSVSDLLKWPISPTVCHPLPPYEIAIQMPAPCSTTTLSTLVSTSCEPPAPTYEDSCRHGSPSLHSISPFYYPSTVPQASSPQRLQKPHSEICAV